METLTKFIEWWFTGLPKAVDNFLSKWEFRGMGLEAPFVALTWLVFFFWLFAHPEAASTVGAMLAVTVPFILPFGLYKLSSEARTEYVRFKNYAGTDFCVLEIKLPEEINQTPYAMELVLRALYQSGAGPTKYHNWKFGEMPAWFSLELASDEGRIHFYIWTRKKLKTIVENQLYAHYPTVQVVEVPDYTLKMPLDPAAVTVTGVEFALQKPDPYPILTYVEIGMDKPGTKEEFKHDPLTSVLEFLGSMKEGEQAWIQFIIRAHDSDMPCAGSAPAAVDSKTKKSLGRAVGIAEWAEIEVENINNKAKSKDANDFSSFMRLTEGDRNNIKAIQNKLNKQLFEVGIRTLYIADKKKAQSPALTGLASTFRSYEHGSIGRGLNGFKPVFWIGPFNFPWHDFQNIRRHMLWERYYEAYTMRQFFYPPHSHPYIVLNTEELASVYHFPGKVVATPTLQRMPSKRAEAPSNLPV